MRCMGFLEGCPTIIAFDGAPGKGWLCQNAGGIPQNPKGEARGMATRTLYRSEGEAGPIEVVQDSAGVRSLHFGTISKQSSVHPEAPHRLVLPYTRLLTAALLFRPAPERILLVGLGGGALAHFFLHYFPEARIDTVESRPEVVAVARDYFGLPVDHPRLTIRLLDAAELLADPRERPPEGWDLIVADAYTAAGPAAATIARAFYGDCRESLAEGGVLAANLWSSNRFRLVGVLRDLEAVLGRPVYRLQARGRGNVAAFAGRPPLPEELPERLGARARELETALDLPYAQYLSEMDIARPGLWEVLRAPF